MDNSIEDEFAPEKEYSIEEYIEKIHKIDHCEKLPNLFILFNEIFSYGIVSVIQTIKDERQISNSVIANICGVANDQVVDLLSNKQMEACTFFMFCRFAARTPTLSTIFSILEMKRETDFDFKNIMESLIQMCTAHFSFDSILENEEIFCTNMKEDRRLRQLVFDVIKRLTWVVFEKNKKRYYKQFKIVMNSLFERFKSKLTGLALIAEKLDGNNFSYQIKVTKENVSSPDRAEFLKEIKSLTNLRFSEPSLNTMY